MDAEPKLEELNKRLDAKVDEWSEVIAAQLEVQMDTLLSQVDYNLSPFLTSLTTLWNDGVSHIGPAQFEVSMTGKKADYSSLIYQQYLEMYGEQKAQQILSTTTRQVQNLVLRGQREGLSYNDVIKTIRNKIPEMASSRARMIADTELHSSGQYASQMLAQYSDFDLLKTWITVQDDRVRSLLTGTFDHRHMHGFKTAVDQPFRVPSTAGVELLMFPGDPVGSAGNVIRCRCAQVYERV